MLIAWDNKADAAAITAGSEVTTLPASNVQQRHLSRKWYTAPAVNSSFIVLDLGASLSCQLLAVLGTNLTSAATVRVRGSVTDPTATGSLAVDTGVVSAGVKDGYGAIYKDLVAAVASRYWRIDIADASLTQLKVGGVFLGPRWAPSVNQEYGWSVRVADPSLVDESYGGQEYDDVRPQRRVLTFGLNYLDEAEMYGNAFALAVAKGVRGDVLAVHNSLGSAYLSEQSVFGRLRVNEPLIHAAARIFRQKFEIWERL
jgi:hypothetical protein